MKILIKMVLSGLGGFLLGYSLKKSAQKSPYPADSGGQFINTFKVYTDSAGRLWTSDGKLRDGYLKYDLVPDMETSINCNDNSPMNNCAIKMDVTRSKIIDSK